MAKRKAKKKKAAKKSAVRQVEVLCASDSSNGLSNMHGMMGLLSPKNCETTYAAFCSSREEIEKHSHNIPYLSREWAQLLLGEKSFDIVVIHLESTSKLPEAIECASSAKACNPNAKVELVGNGVKTVRQPVFDLVVDMMPGDDPKDGFELLMQQARPNADN